MDREVALCLVGAPMQFAAVHKGDVVCIFGAMEQWRGRWQIWSVMGENAGRWMFQLTKMGLAFVNELEGHRIDATVEADFKAGHRWMRMLGFAPEAVLVQYLPDGTDVVQYVQLREIEE